MKALWLPFLFLLPLSEALAQAQAGSHGTIARKQNVLEEMVQSDPELKQKLGNCYETTPENGDIAACLWDGIGEAKQKQILAALEESGVGQQKLDSSAPGVTLDQFTKNQDGLSKQALDKLGAFYSKRLAEELGSNTATIKINDQSTYYELAKVQLGKNVMTAWSSLCLDMGWDTGSSPERMYTFKDDSKRAEIRKSNLAGLNSITSDPNASGDNPFKSYSQCISHIALLCREANGKTKAQENAVTVDYGQAYASSTPKIAGNTIDEDDIKYTRERACEIHAYVAGIQKQLQATEVVAERFGQGIDKGAYFGAGVFKEHNYSNDKAIKYDDVTTVTSGDVVAEGSYYRAIKDNQELLAQCSSPNPPPECKDLLSSAEQTEDLRATGAAFMLETKAVQEQIAKAQTEDDKRKLIQQLRPDLEVSELSVQDLEHEFQKISQQYRNEREHLISNLSERVRQLEASDDQGRTQSNMKTAADNLLKRGNEYVQLMHYNNIVTGFLNVVKSNGEETKNTRVIQLELERVAMLSTEDRIGQSDYQSLFGDGYSDNLNRDLKRDNPDIGQGVEENSAVRLDSSNIAKFNDYIVEP